MPSSAFQTCALDRKSTRLNSSHTIISYAVFCLKKNQAGVSSELARELEDYGLLAAFGSGADKGDVEAYVDVAAVCALFFLMSGDPRNLPPFPTPAVCQ